MTQNETRDARIATALAHWLTGKIAGAEDMAIEAVQTAKAAGFSAETVFFDARWRQDGKPRTEHFVLRRQILGHDLLHQPDLSFQAHVLEAMSGQPSLNGLVPGLIGVETDAGLLGAPFLVMQRLPGQIVAQNPNYNKEGWVADLPLPDRHRVWENGINAMAAVNKIGWQDSFGFLGRGKTPGLAGYVAWVEDWMRWAVNGRSFPVGEQTIDYLKREMPADAELGVVWGDPLSSNMLFDAKGNVTGLLDWELATAGPGEIDLAWWLMFDQLFSADMHVPRLPGLPNREEVIALYETAMGRKVRNIEYYEILSRLRMGIIAMRSVDRNVAQGKFKADNDAWSHNPFTAVIAQKLGFAPVNIGPDYFDFIKTVMAKE